MKLKKILPWTLLWGALCLPGWSQPTLRKVLPNGIPVIVQESATSPTVSLNIYIRVGSVFEPDRINGISHFYEHMFFRGTPTRSGHQFKRDIEALGGQTNATTGRDYTHFYINLPKQYLRQGLELLADAYLNAECAQESVDAERIVVLEEYRLGLVQPARIMADRLYKMVFPNHPYGNTIIGPEETLKAISRQDLLQFKRDFYVPARTKLVVAGDIEPTEVLAECRRLFGNYKAQGSTAEPVGVQKPPAETQKTTEFSKTGKGMLALAYLGPSVKQRQDVIRMDLLSFLLGNTKSSLLGRAIDAKTTGNSADVQYLTQAYPGIIMVLVGSESGKEEETLKKIDAVLADVRQGKIDEADIKRAKKTLITMYRFGNETNAGKADQWGTYETIDRFDFATSYVQEIQKLTKADLAQAAEKYFGQPHYRLVMQGKKSGVTGP